MLRDPAEVAEEERLKKEAREKQIRERQDLFNAGWKAYYKYFPFKDVVWTGEKFFEEAVNENRIRPFVFKPSHLLESEGHPVKEVVLSHEGAFSVVKAWLQRRYMSQGDVKEGEPCEQAARISGVDSNQEEWTLQDVIAFSNAYGKVYVDIDPNAGFAQGDVETFRTAFDIHRGGHDELKPEKLWALLEEFGMEFPTVEQQKHVLDVLHEVDKNRNGVLDMEELLHLFRKLIDDGKAEPREREFKLLLNSGMPLDECERWFEVFSKSIEERLGGEPSAVQSKSEYYISIGDVKSVFEPLGLKFDRERTEQMKNWLAEVDTDFNGQIDFGEFCTLVQRMWDANFCSIRSLCGEAKQGD